MKWALVGCILTISLLGATTTRGVAVTDPAANLSLEHDALLISAFSFDETLRFVEVHNQSGQPLWLGDWTVTITYRDHYTRTEGREVITGTADGWLLVDGYLTIGRSDAVSGQSFAFESSGDTYELVALRFDSNAGSTTVSVPPDADSLPVWYERKSGSAGQGGVFSDFNRRTASIPEQPNDSGLYYPPTPLKGVLPVEVYARAGTCNPLKYDDVLCGDYVKLYNGTQSEVDLSPYRLRTDSGGEAPGVGNAVSLAAYGSIEPGGFVAIYLRDDGRDLQLTDSGGFIWLEDQEGIGGPYQSTVIQYPSFGSASKQGWSWAQKGAGTWEWTVSPQPLGANQFTLPIEEKTSKAGVTYKPCAPNQYRNPETNRCKLKAVATSALAQCAPGSVRNPETNRCRKVTAAASLLTPCKERQVRNPETNRCRSATLGANQFKPCAPGQARNPETNRCRKVGNPLTNVAAVKPQDLATLPQSFPWGNLILGATGVAALGYGVYEWRVELRQFGRKVVGLLAKR